MKTFIESYARYKRILEYGEYRLCYINAINKYSVIDISGAASGWDLNSLGIEIII